MRCFSYCFGREEKTNHSSINSVEGRDKMLLKGNKLMQFNSSKKLDAGDHGSPFRGRCVKENNFLQQESSSSINAEDRNKLKYSKHRYSFIDQKSLENVNIPKVTEEKKTTHWEKKDRFKCLFCGGEKCKHENYLRNKNYAIIGLNSDFITDDIIASQRPSTILINKFDLVNVFKQMKIGLIVNVQREGEHPYCGPNKKLEESGFTYNPHHFLSGDIQCKISGWKDMSVPQSVNFMLDIVRDMSIMIKEKHKKVSYF
jgi:hypothetical protein